MQHILIGIYIITFTAGFISIYHSISYYKIYKYSFLKTYVYHIICVNLIVLSSAASRYYKANLFGSVGSTDIIKAHFIMDVLFLVQKGIEFFIIIGIGYTIVKIVFQIQENVLNRKIHVIFIFLLVLSAFCYGGSTVHFLNTNDPYWLFFSYDSISYLVAALVIGYLIFNLIKNRTLNKGSEKKILGIFSYFYLISILTPIVHNIFKMPYHTIFAAVILFAVNIFPVIWIRYMHHIIAQNFVGIPNNMINIDRLVSEYNISEREREIFELILKGYSNKEIQQQLFLSFHTVKNHNYNLYKKLGVRNRGELIRLVMDSN